LDILGRSTAATRRLAVPNSNEGIAVVHYIPAHMSVCVPTQFGLVAWITTVILDEAFSQQDRLPTAAQQFQKLLPRLLGGKVFQVVFESHRENDIKARVFILEHGPRNDAVCPFCERAQNAVRARCCPATPSETAS
jgi:hypothetical protein